MKVFSEQLHTFLRSVQSEKSNFLLTEWIPDKENNDETFIGGISYFYGFGTG